MGVSGSIPSENFENGTLEEPADDGPESGDARNDSETFRNKAALLFDGFPVLGSVSVNSANLFGIAGFKCRESVRVRIEPIENAAAPTELSVENSNLGAKRRHSLKEVI